MTGSKAAFGGWNCASGAWVGFGSHAQRPAECLEQRFRLMVGVFAAQVVDVQADCGVIGQPLEKLVDQVDVELADHRPDEIDIENQAGASRQIHHHARQRFIQWHIGMAIAAQPLLVADRPGDRLSQSDADVFNGVMGVDMQIALGFDFKIQHAMPRDLVQHVIEEADARSQPGPAGTVEIEFDPNLRLECLASDFPLPHGDVVTEIMQRYAKMRQKTMGICGAVVFSPLTSSPCYHSGCSIIIEILMNQTSKYWSDVVGDLTPYVPGEQPKLDNLVKLNTNENPYGPSPRVLEALRGEVGATLRLYPDPNAEQLKLAAAGFHGIAARQVFAGNGSDEVLAHVFLALLKHSRPLLFPDISYSFYPVYCQLYGIGYLQVPLDESYGIRVDDYRRPNGGIIFPNPNAPTGRLLSLAEIERLLTANTDSVVVIDEAYVAFAENVVSAVPLIDKYANLLVVQTLSKSHSLAGLRVGFAFGQSHLIEALERVKNSFNSYPLDRLAIAGAVAACEDRAYFEKTRRAVIASREVLVGKLLVLGFEVLPSAANFIFVRHPGHDAASLAAALRERSIIVRHFRQPRIEQFLRITVGTDQQCEALVAALRAILA